MDVSRAFKSRSMKSMLGDHLLRNGLPRITYKTQTDQKTRQPAKLLAGPSDVSCTWRQHKVGSLFNTMNKFDKIAFCSDRAIAKVSSPTGEAHRFQYKVVIPLCKIKRANQITDNLKKKGSNSHKYLQVVTKDDFEFWFMGFVNCLRLSLASNRLLLPT